MNLQGFIREIGTPRQWKTKENEPRETYPLIISVPFVGKDGKEHSDDFLAEINVGNKDYIENVRKHMENHDRMEFRVGFSIREWEKDGKKSNFQKASVFDIQILI